MGKVLIAGVGRSGTTFLMRLFTMLGLDTPFDTATMHRHITARCNAGMETDAAKRLPPQRILKAPQFSMCIDQLVRRGEDIDTLIVPFRRLDECVKSRVRLGRANGGLWMATDAVTQRQALERAVATLVQDAVLHDIPILFLSFDRMTSDPAYLYDAIRAHTDIFDAVSPEDFHQKYATATEASRPPS